MAEKCSGLNSACFDPFPKRRGKMRFGGAGGVALTFRRLRHGGGETVHVVAAIAVITEEQLVLSRAGGKGGGNSDDSTRPWLKDNTEGTRVPLCRPPSSIGATRKTSPCPPDYQKHSLYTPPKDFATSYRLLKPSNFPPKRLSHVLQTTKAQRFLPKKDSAVPFCLLKTKDFPPKKPLTCPMDY